MLNTRNFSRLSVLLLIWLVVGSGTAFWPTTTEAATVPGTPHVPGIAPPDFFGVVGRDPWYEWNTNPRYDGSNVEFLESMAAQLKAMGAHYIRIEFRADPKPGTRGGEVNFAKYDAFVNDIAPRYGLKVLGLLGFALVNWDTPGDSDLHYRHYNDPADRPDGTNLLIRTYAARAQEVIAHYGERVATWEVLNEFNYWEGVSLQPERMGALMVTTYGLGKSANPKATIIVGAQLALERPTAPINSTDYLNAFYHSAAVQNYFKQPHPASYNGNPFPWDGLAWHPYFANVWDAVQSVRGVLKIMRGWGDSRNKLWITEIGQPANLPSDNGCGPGESQQEADQARYLSDFFTQLSATSLNDIGAVFWFKYEDFYDGGNGVVPFGLVRLQPAGNQTYAPTGTVTRYKPAYYAYQRLAGPELPSDSLPAPAPASQWSPTNPSGAYYFPQTGHSLSGSFLSYWQRNGGVALFGYPLTEPFEELNPDDGKRYIVQYFERERFEYHPQNPLPYDVLLGLLGANRVVQDCRSFQRVAGPTTSLPPTRLYFNQTGHYLGGGFKNYWDTQGGLALFGYPISEEIGETSPTDGKQYTVQYFERARFEFHPNEPPAYQIQLALLGSDLLRRRGWLK